MRTGFFDFRHRDAPDDVPPLDLIGGMPPPAGSDWDAPDAGHAVDDPDQPPPPRPRKRWRLRWIIRGIGVLIVLFFVAVGWLAVTAPLSKSLEPISPPSITLLASDGTPIARRGATIGKPVDVKRLPEHVTQAFIAIEDRRFYSHWGVDPWGIGRAMAHNVAAGGLREGGSTITQQLAKNAFLDSDRTAGRKLREVLIAFWLEAWLTKDDILSRYLSNVYFGDNVYGLSAAAKHYFSTTPDRLTTGQAAMLAGLVKAPSRLAPTGNLEGARARQRLVVNAMVAHGFLTASEAADIGPARLKVDRTAPLPNGSYFADWVLPAARDQAGAITTETRVMTTLDARLQRAAERAVRRAGLNKAQVAIVAMRPDGRIVAMVGGRRYADSPFNRATQARRQAGSAFKLFVYFAALRSGLTPESTIADEPVTIGAWSPKNNDGRYRGEISLREAFAISSNVAAARLTQQVGVGKVIAAARDLGISTPLPNEATIALGTANTSLLELTAAYAAVAAGAYPVRPHGLEEARERSWVEFLGNRSHSLGERMQDQLKDLLSASINDGTGRQAALAIDSFGKTGTSQDSRDALFVGYANGLVVGVWIGNDDNSPLQGIYGGGLPARIWRDFMVQANGQAVPRKAPPARAEDPGTPVQPLDIPEIPAIPIDDKTSVGVKDGNAVISTEIGGTKVDLKLPIGDRPPAPPPAPAQTPP